MINRNTILSTIGVIVLGALGSGMWELIKPLFGWGSSFILSILTLGLESLRDGIYSDAAEKFSDVSQIQGSGIGMVISMVLIVGTMLSLLAGILSIGTDFGKFGNKIRRQRIAVPLFFLLFAILFLGLALRHSYENRLLGHYLKLSTIAAPYLSDTEMKRHHSEFSRVQTREQYLKQIEKLNQAIQQNGIEPPTRDFF